MNLLNRDKELLESLCLKHKVPYQLLEELLLLEKEVQHQDKRYRIKERIRDCVRENMKPTSTRDII